MTHWQTGRYLCAIGIAGLFLIYSLGMVHLPLLDQIESVLYDFKVRQTAPNTKDSRIVIVDIDEKSLEKVGQWPWRRDRLADLVDILFEHYRIGVLGFDMVFSEIDSGSALAQFESLARGPLSQDTAFLTQFHKLRPALDKDRLLSQSLSDRPVILGFNFRHTSFSGSANSGKLPPPVMALRDIGIDRVNMVKASGYHGNVSEIQESAFEAGFIDNPLISFDGAVRRVPMMQVFDGALYQSLSLGVIRAILGDPPLTLGIRANGKSGPPETGLEWIALGPHKIPVDARGSILVPYRGKQGSFPYFSAVDILERVTEKKDLDAAIVLVGSSVEGLINTRLTPIQQAFPSVEIHANIVSGMLDGTFKNSPDYSPWSDILIMVTITAIITIFFPWIIVPWRFLIVGILFFCLLLGNAYAWLNLDLDLPMAAPTILVFLLFLVDIVFDNFGISRKRKHLVRLLGKHVSVSTIEEMVRENIAIAPFGEEREMTVMVSSVRDFSRLSKNVVPRELAQWIQGFLTPMTETIHRHNGTLDHYNGESIVAFWGAPREDSRHGYNAISAVKDMVNQLDKLEDEFRMRGWPSVKCNFAIQSGTVMTGIIRSRFRNDFTAIGEPVRFVLWLNSLANRYASPILAGDKIKSAIPDMVFRELDKITSESSGEALSIYEPVDFREQVSPELYSRIEAFHMAVGQFRKGEWDLAEQGLKNLLQKDPEDRIYEVYLARIREYRITPPPPNWNGSCPPPPIPK